MLRCDMQIGDVRIRRKALFVLSKLLRSNAILRAAVMQVSPAAAAPDNMMLVNVGRERELLVHLPLRSQLAWSGFGSDGPGCVNEEEGRQHGSLLSLSHEQLHAYRSRRGATRQGVSYVLLC